MGETTTLDGSVVVGIIENKAKEVGIAALDLRTATLHLSQHIETSRSYQNTITLLKFYSPSDIISMNTKSSPGAFSVASVVDSPPFKNARKVQLPRGCFDDTHGAVTIEDLGAEAATVKQLYKQHYLSFGAANAVLKWVESEKGVIIQSKSLRVTFNVSADHMAIDSASVANLELIEPFQKFPYSGAHQHKKASLFNLLNSTKTIGGARLLKANLLQPLKDEATLNARLDCLDEILSKEDLHNDLSRIIQKFPKDVDRSLCSFAFSSKRVSDEAGVSRRNQVQIASILSIKEAVGLFPLLAEVLEGAESDILTQTREICLLPSISSLKTSIEGVLSEDCSSSRQSFVARTQQCFAVKAGVDGMLDVARQNFSETATAIHDLAQHYREEWSMPALKLNYKGTQGFYLRVPIKECPGNQLPKACIRVSKQGKNTVFSTQQLVSLNARNKNAASECLLRTEHALQVLFDVVNKELRLLMVLSELLSLLDMLVNAFASTITAAPEGSYARPEFTVDGPLAIESGRHPVMDNLVPRYVANNTFLFTASNVMVITGPNMSGKSTYLKQVALITIMAQVGCYVPADFASMRLVDVLLTRIGTGDSMEANASTFMMEMRETAYILQKLTDRSLIVIDELGRATSTADGLAIAWSTAEEILLQKGYAIIATHMQRLAELCIAYPNVKVCYFVVEPSDGHIGFLYKLKEGYTDIPNYGLLLSEVAGIPKCVINDAKTIAAIMEKKEVERFRQGVPRFHNLRKYYQVGQKILCLQHAKQDKGSMRKYLAKLKADVTTTAE